jgi:hypothetical protein
VRHGRSIVAGSVILGVLLVFLAWNFRGGRLYPSLMTVGVVLAICGSLRYLALQREYPKVHAEFQNAEKFWPE